MKKLRGKIQKGIKPLIALIVISMFCSCASILSGRKQKVNITSYPSGARIYVNGKDQGVITPSTIKLPRKKSVSLVFQKSGYEDGTLEQGSSFNFATLGNILLGGIPGFLIDWGTGAIYKYPSNINYNFQTPTTPQLGPVAATPVVETQPVSRESAGRTVLEQTIIRWYFDSYPQGVRLYWRVISSVPEEVKNTNELYLAPTPYEETRSFNIVGLTYENSNNVTIEIRARKAGYMDQVKRFNVRQAIDQQEISSFFEMVKMEPTE